MENDAKFNKAKASLANNIILLRKNEEIVGEFFRRIRSLEKYYPEIKSFNDYLSVFKPKMAVSRREKLLELYEYQEEKKRNSNAEGNITNYYAPDFLGVSDKVFKKMLSMDLIKPTGYTEFRKWGKDLKTPYFDYDYLYKIKHESLKDLILTVEGFGSKGEKLEWEGVVNEMTSEFPIVLKRTAWHRIIPFERIGYVLTERISIGLTQKNFMDKDLGQIKGRITRLLPKFDERNRLINGRLNKLLDEIEATDSELMNFETIEAGLSEEKFFEAVERKIEHIIYERHLSETERILDLKNYQDSFQSARSILRKVNFIVGPTNSGKTYQALQSLKKARTGVYLAPLRLMALEIYEALNAAGVPCNLVTGEESIFVPNAKHTSSTIECMSLDKFVDCAVIDEIQMISDSERGWAWTNALLGVPAKEVFAIGNATALNKAVDLIEKVEDDYEIFHKERMSNLRATRCINIEELKKGDALIAFSKKQVLSYAVELREKGRKVSIVYGALSPEVRMRQAKLFYTGENDILVSTDAIGMGLNLPLDRVVFSSLEKYDGKSNRLLNNTEIKQIGGRAGRFNSDGEVCALESCESDSGIIKRGLDAVEKQISRFPIAPNEWHVSIIRDIMGTNSIARILDMFPVLCNSKDFYSLENGTMAFIADYIDHKFRSLDPVHKLKFCFTPLDVRSDRQVEFFRQVINTAFIKKRYMSFPKYDNFRDQGTYNGLGRAEEELKMMTMFKHLSKHTAYIDLSGLEERKKQLEEYIFKALLNVEVPESRYNYYNDYFGYL